MIRHTGENRKQWILLMIPVPAVLPLHMRLSIH